MVTMKAAVGSWELIWLLYFEYCWWWEEIIASPPVLCAHQHVGLVQLFAQSSKELCGFHIALDGRVVVELGGRARGWDGIVLLGRGFRLCGVRGSRGDNRGDGCLNGMGLRGRFDSGSGGRWGTAAILCFHERGR